MASAAPRAPSKAGHRGIRKLVTFPHNPVACNSQTQTTTTTKTFRIVLILEAMGMYRLIRYNATPTIINTTTRFSKGIFLLLQIQDGAIRCPMLRRRVSSPWKAMGARAWLVEEPGLALMCGSQQTTGARQMIECGQIGSPPGSTGFRHRNRWKPLPDGRGSVSLAKSTRLCRSRDRQGAVSPKRLSTQHPSLQRQHSARVVRWYLAAVPGFQLFAGYFRREPISSLRRPWAARIGGGKV